MKTDKLIAHTRVKPGRKVSLAKDFDPAWTPPGLTEKKALRRLQDDIAGMIVQQDMLYAQDRHSLLVIVQAMDAAGKDGVIKHVMSGLNPQGCQVVSFKAPSAEELDHDFLWRCVKALPERGRIGIFNRSYYEEVLVVRVHPEILRAQHLPAGAIDDNIWTRRFEAINALEKHLVDNGTYVLKLFLNVSRKEQKKRFLDRIEEPEKNWKFSAADLHERAFWNDYMRAYEDMLRRTSTSWAPWHVIPADHKWVTRLAVGAIVRDALEKLDLAYPKVTAEQRRELAKARKALLAGE